MIKSKLWCVNFSSKKFYLLYHRMIKRIKQIHIWFHDLLTYSLFNKIFYEFLFSALYMHIRVSIGQTWWNENLIKHIIFQKYLMKGNIKFLINIFISKFRLFPINTFSQIYTFRTNKVHHSNVHVLSYCIINNISSWTALINN